VDAAEAVAVSLLAAATSASAAVVLASLDSRYYNTTSSFSASGSASRVATPLRSQLQSLP